MEKYRQQMKKGVLDMVVLATVAQKPTYGYQLLTALDEDSGGVFRLKEGTLYPVLYRLEDEGLIKADWQNGEGRTTPKKYYAVTKTGQTQLGEMQTVWGEFVTSVNGLMHKSGKTAKEVGA